MPSGPTQLQHELRQLIQNISKAWQAGQPEKLREFFHEDMVIVGPAYQEMGAGREACIQSYSDFLRKAVIHAYKEAEPVVRVWTTTGVASYHWEMTYEMKGQVSREQGMDLFVCQRQPDRWLAVWRAVTLEGMR
jgi:uncharacterized protein (TIGR02246 family)